jgi:peptidoglycan/xylan/chitin deacetylase (PgdA/CDA1 family)
MVASTDLGYVPILMYHYIRIVDASTDPLGYRLSVAPDAFAAQMDWIADNGYTPITMATFTACLRGQQTCPARPVVLTFDDGYADNALEALPVLQQRGFVGTFFIVSGRVGAPGYMTPEQLVALRDAGMEIGAHTVTHADLTQLARDAATVEMRDSRVALEELLGITVRSFSYPAGKYNADLERIAYEIGFESAVITQSFRGFDQLYAIPRRRVLGGEPIGAFRYNFVPLTR